MWFEGAPPEGHPLSSAHVALLFQTLISAATYLVAKATLGEIGPVPLAWLRFVLAGGVFLGLLAARGIPLLPPRGLRGRVLLLWFLGQPLNQGLFLLGLSRTSAAHAAILYALTPAVVLVLARILLGEVISLRQAGAVGLAFSGVLVMLLERGLAAELEPLTGDLLVLGAVIAWGNYTVLVRPLAREHGPVAATGWAIGAGAVLSLPLAPLALGDPSQLLEASAWAWGGVAFLVLVTSVVAYLLWSHALQRLTAARVAIFTNLQPVATAVLSYVVLGERITAGAAVGGLLVVAGVTLSQRRPGEPISRAGPGSRRA